MAELVMLTSASGKQCAHIIPLLYRDSNYQLRLVANRDESAAKLKKTYPNAEVTTADLTQPADCGRIVAGAGTVVHIGPTYHPHETAIGYNMIDACLSPSGSSLKHFVYSSVLHTQLRKLMNHDSKRYVEEYLIESHLPWTIVSPTIFVEQYPIQKMVQQQRSGHGPVFYALSNPDIPQSWITLTDLGEAFAKVVREREQHFYALYPLTSGQPITSRSFIELCEKQIGTKIRIERLSREAAEEGLMVRVFGDPNKVPLESREQAQRMLLHYESRGLQGNPNTLQFLLGRKPTSYEEWIKGQIEKATEGQ